MMFAYIVVAICYLGIAVLITKGIERFVEPTMMEDDEQ